MHSEADRIRRYQRLGHTHHCACRIVWGDGECECNFKDVIPGSISNRMYQGVCNICLKKDSKEHEDWCKNK